MRTPTGRVCKYFYGDYYRGRVREECRLLGGSSAPQNWTSDLCATCPVPDVLRANACQYMQLNASVQRLFPYIRRQMNIKAYCTKSQSEVPIPHVGCGQCHTLPPIFTGEPREPDTSG